MVGFRVDVVALHVFAQPSTSSQCGDYAAVVFFPDDFVWDCADVGRVDCVFEGAVFAAQEVVRRRIFHLFWVFGGGADGLVAQLTLTDFRRFALGVKGYHYSGERVAGFYGGLGVTVYAIRMRFSGMVFRVVLIADCDSLLVS